MKPTFIVSMAMFVLISCNEDPQKKLIGCWNYQGSEINHNTQDTTWSDYYIEFTDSDTVYFLIGTRRPNKIYISGYDENWGYSSINFDSLRLKYNFITDEKDEFIYPDSSIRVFTRFVNNKRPNELFFNLYNKYGQGQTMRIDTLGDGTLICNLDIPGSDNKNILAIEKEVKFFTDKQLGFLPQSEEVGKYSSWSHGLLNVYEWEDLRYKVIMENHFNFKDLEDAYDFNDEDELEVKIWLNVK